MAYYYHSHIRNLEEEALLEKRKIAAEIYEKDVLESNLKGSAYRKQNSLKRSRREQELQTAAYLQRSRLSAQLSAMRIKAENTMNRSRIEAAFQIRKQNQKAIQELQKMNQRHFVIQKHAHRQGQIAKIHYETSRRLAEELYNQEKLLQTIANNQNLKIEAELSHAQRIQQLLKQTYYPY